MKQSSEPLINRLVRVLKDGADLCNRYWAEGLGLELQTAAKHIQGTEFKGTPSELRDVMDLIDGYHEFLLEKGHKFLAKEICQLQATLATFRGTWGRTGYPRE
jgi:hypothetical protein